MEQNFVEALSELDPTKTLIISHKDTHDELQKMLPGFRFTWWGNLDGKNTWIDCDNVVIFGHNYLNELYAINSILTILGLPEDECFADNKKFQETKNDFMQRHLAAVCVQGINRGQCRNVTDDRGGCEPTRVFFVSPRGKSGRDLLDRIKGEMPGIQEKTWEFRLDPPKDDLQEGSSQSKLYEFMQNKPAGKYVLGDIPGFTPRQLQMLRENLSEPKHTLTLALSEANTQFVPGQGRGRPAQMVKRS